MAGDISSLARDIGLELTTNPIENPPSSVSLPGCPDRGAPTVIVDHPLQRSSRA